MLTQLHEKPFVLKLDNKVRTVGVISDAVITPGRTSLLLTVTITDEEVAGILGAAQDKNEAAASPIGLSDAEIEDAIADPGPLALNLGDVA